MMIGNRLSLPSPEPNPEVSRHRRWNFSLDAINQHNTKMSKQWQKKKHQATEPQPSQKEIIAAERTRLEQVSIVCHIC